MSIGQNVFVCASCPHRQKRASGGVALCLQSGRDHLVHAMAGECPDGRFVESPVTRFDPVASALEARRLACGACAAFTGFAETVGGFEADGLPEMAGCSACGCPLKRVNVRKGPCPKGRW